MILTQQRVPTNGAGMPGALRPGGRAVAILLAALLICCGGFARGQTQPAVAPPVAAPVAEPVAAPVAEPAVEPIAPHPQPSETYRLKPKDVVHVKVFQEEDLETAGRIDNDGNIFFPLLGQAKIGGQTVQEATASLESLLRKYLIHPQVSIEITSYAKEHFTILGQVNKPGIFDFPDEGSLNLLEALGMAGGYTKIANPSKIIIKRYTSGTESVIKVDGKKLLDPHYAAAPVFQVQPGDTINVGEAIF